MGNQRITIRDISQASGVSICTVSKALRGDPKISETTRNKVMEVAESLGYRPDPELKKLMAYVSRKHKQGIRSSIGMLTPYRSKKESQLFDYFKIFEKTVIERAAQHGYHIDVLYMGDPTMRPERLRNIIRTRNFDGIVVSPTGNTEPELLVDTTPLPTVSCQRVYYKPSMNRVEPDYYRNTLTALQNTFNNGYRRPFLVLTGGVHELTDGMIQAAYRQFCASTLQEPAPNAYISDSYNYSELPAMLKKHKIDCIIGNSLFTLNWLHKNGYTPETMGFAALNLIPKADRKQLKAPFRMNEISGIDVQSEVIDATVVDILIGMILRHERGEPENPQIVSIQGKWHEGKTLPCK